MHPYTLVEDNITRTGVFRQDGPTVDHICMWLHGASGSGQVLMSKVPVHPGVLHVCPNALIARNGKSAFVPPGLVFDDPFYTPEIPDDQHDARVVNATLAKFKALHPSADLHAGGSSKGGEMILGAHAWADELNLTTFRACKGLYIARAGVPFVPTDGSPAFLGWGFAERVAAGKVTPRSLMYIHGSEDTDTVSQEFAGGDTFANSADALAASAQVTLGPWGAASPPTACGFELQRRIGLTPTHAMLDFHAVNAPHAFFDCDDLNEIGKAMWAYFNFFPTPS